MMGFPIGKILKAGIKIARVAIPAVKAIMKIIKGKKKDDER